MTASTSKRSDARRASARSPICEPSSLHHCLKKLALRKPPNPVLVFDWDKVRKFLLPLLREHMRVVDLHPPHKT